MTFDTCSRSFAEKLRLGAFYTPPELTKIICQWAIRSPLDRVLEPSFGGCGFLSSSRDRLRTLGATRPGSQIYGCDIDSLAFKYLESVIGDINQEGRFLKRDFLKCRPVDFKSNACTAIVGNPPYLSRHRMPTSMRKQVDSLLTPSGVVINRMSALWVYFIYHSLSFLDNDGRMAWVLPASYLHADYAHDLRSYLTRIFSDTHAVMLPYGTFSHEGVGEPTVALLLDGYKRKGNQKQIITSVSSIQELHELVDGFDAGRSVVSKIIITRNYDSKYEKLKRRDDVTQLGKLFDISIGIVTGNNRFFVISNAQAKVAKLPKGSLKPVVALSSHLTNLSLTAADLKALEQDEQRVLLFRPTTRAARTPAIRRYLGRYPIEARNDNVTFSKRRHWYIPPKPQSPDAFMTCMDKAGPRLILNRSGSDCTNTLYRLTANTNLSLVDRRLIAISVLSSFTALSAEKLGRRFKSGSLKLEPSTVKALFLILPTIRRKDLVRKLYKRVDALVRIGNYDAARTASDDTLIALTDDSELKHMLKSAAAELITMRTNRQSK